MSVLDEFVNKKESLAIEWVEIIEYMLNDQESYGYAEGTLVDILTYAQDKGTITAKQIKAVENIKNAPSNPYHNGRRY